MATNIADWIDYWESKWRGSFDRDLYIAYLIAKQNDEPMEKKVKLN